LSPNSDHADMRSCHHSYAFGFRCFRLTSTVRSWPTLRVHKCPISLGLGQRPASCSRLRPLYGERRPNSVIRSSNSRATTQGMSLDQCPICTLRKISPNANAKSPKLSKVPSHGIFGRASWHRRAVTIPAMPHARAIIRMITPVHDHHHGRTRAIAIKNKHVAAGARANDVIPR
jgi:hypothetical protein